ncbi:MAG: DUF1269 domain-containing protein [Myxococcota bacterium]
MNKFIAICDPDRFRAAEVRLELIKLQTEYLIDPEDAVVATRTPKGKIRLDQPVNLTAAGAADTGLWGTLIGLLFMNLLLGAGIGAAASAVRGALTDVGISDDMMKAIASGLTENDSALFVLVRSATIESFPSGSGSSSEGARRGTCRRLRDLGP